MEKKKEFEDLALSNLSSLYSFALGMLKDPSESEDMVQETILKSYEQFHQFKKGSNCKAWLFTIMKNLCIDRFRKERSRPVLVGLDNQPSLYPAPDDTLIDSILPSITSEEIRDAIAGLPIEYRLPVTLRDIEGLTYREIGEIMGCPEGTVMSRLYRGRRLLKRILMKKEKGEIKKWISAVK
ncbi:MAG: sigma-70 family RNA polymerase sigma factor [Nitrospinae bacterium]|nr:sigma-70 family RNA polymerase sigma factor [Nitrospinota bacterium]